MGAWIEISIFTNFFSVLICRTPRWVRGLKSQATFRRTCSKGRTPRWVRGLKYLSDTEKERVETRRTPRWVRGLKSFSHF